MRWIGIGVLCMICTVARAQYTVEQLENMLPDATEEKKIAIYRELGMLYWGNEPDKFLHYTTLSCKQAQKLHIKYDEAYALRLIGIYHDERGEYVRALKLIDSALVINRRIGSDDGMEACYGSLGIIHFNRGNYDEAIANYLAAIRIFEKTGNVAGEATYTSHVGGVHKALKDYRTALKYYERAYKLANESGDTKTKAVVYNNYGSALYNVGEEDKAREILNQSLAMKEELGEKRGLSYSYENVAHMAYTAGDTAEYIRLMGKSIAIREELGDKGGLALSYNDVGRKLNHLKNYKDAIEYLTKSYKIASEIGHLQMISSSASALGTAYYYTGDYKSSADFLYYYGLVKDSINTADRAEARAKMLAEFDTERKEKEIAILAKENQLRQTELMMSKESELRQAQELELLAQQKENERMKREQAEIEKKEQAQEIEMLNMDKQLQESELELKESKLAKQAAEKEKADALNRKQAQQLYAALGGIALLMALAFLILRSYRQKKKANILLAQQNDEITEQKEEISFQKLTIEEKNKDIMDSIQYAKRLQDAILPPTAMVNDLLGENFVLFMPKDVVAGDFYWVEEKDGVCFWAAADCTGHGVPGAMVSVVCSNALHRAVNEFELKDPGLILDKVRELVIQTFEKSESEVRDGMDIALVAMQQEKAEGQSGKAKVQYAGANNPLWILRSGAEEFEVLKADKQPIGSYDSPKPFETKEVEVNPGDMIYSFSDGYQDQFGGNKNKKFKASNMRRLLLGVRESSMKEQGEEMYKVFEQWRGDYEQVDDVCVIGVRV